MSFPAFHRAQFLPVNAETLEAGASADTCEVKDARVPKDLSVLSHRLVHVHDERGENFVIEYMKPMLCQDGILRKKVFIRCRRRHEPEGSTAHKAGHERAEKQAWEHINAVLNNTGKKPNVIVRFGKGELVEGEYCKHHGDSHEDNTFRVHPSHPAFGAHGIMQWSPNVDTLLPGREFCCSAKLVRKRSDGVEIWKCPGHEMTKSELNIADD